MPAARKSDERASVIGVTSAWLTVLAILIGMLTATPAEAASEPAAAPSTATGAQVESAIVLAADLSQFRPVNIIADAVFFNRATMTEAQVQSFFQAKVPTCQTGYTCLKDWYDTSRTTTADAMC